MTEDQSPKARMYALCRRLSLTQLADVLEELGLRKDQLSEYERLSLSIVFEVICEKCPAVDQAVEAWAASDDTDASRAYVAMIAAAREAAK
jgi:hypothetical protein